MKNIILLVVLISCGLAVENMELIEAKVKGYNVITWQNQTYIDNGKEIYQI